MARGQKPDYIVKLPVNRVWHRLGAAWNNEGGTINVVLDVGAALTFPPATKLVLLPPKDEEGAEFNDGKLIAESENGMPKVVQRSH